MQTTTDEAPHATNVVLDEPQDADASVGPHIRLLGTFELSVGSSVVPLPLSAQRLLALLALADAPLQRCHVSGTLWPDKSESRAMANLRSTLWRVRQPGLELIDATATTLSLAPEVRVDTRLLAAGLSLDGLDGSPLRLELLADWYDDWVLVERERLRHLQLAALETLCDDLVRAGEITRAVDVGLRLVAMEPLRESSHRALAAAHLADDNVGEAARQFDGYRELVKRELGVDPSSAFVEMSPAFAHRLQLIGDPLHDHRRSTCRAPFDRTAPS